MSTYRFLLPWFHAIYIYMYVLLLNHVFDLSMLQARNFHILFCLLIEYDLYLLSLPFFRLSVVQHFYHSYSSVLWWIWPLLPRCKWSFLNSPLDSELQTLFYLMLIYIFLAYWCICIFMMRFNDGCPEKEMWSIMILNYVIHKVLVHFLNETLSKFW